MVKKSISRDKVRDEISNLLIKIQSELFDQAKNFRDRNTHVVETYKDFKSIIKSGGFVRCGWDGSEDTEAKIKDETKATIRCVPFDENPENLKQMILLTTRLNQEPKLQYRMFLRMQKMYPRLLVELLYISIPVL